MQPRKDWVRLGVIFRMNDALLTRRLLCTHPREPTAASLLVTAGR
jgi:hypothetical protein|eukprot:COSAG02_NODE_116_length_35392_cov_302.150001_3_plen_45_part_00